jgi:hypothetical protein
VIEARNNRGELIPMGGFPFSATCKDPSGKPVGVEVKDNTDGTLSAQYTPWVAGKHVVEVTLNGVPIGGANGFAKSPFVVMIGAAVVDPTKCQMYGPGLEGGHVSQVSKRKRERKREENDYSHILVFKVGKFTIKAFNRFGTPIESNDTKFLLRVTGPR